MPTVTVFKPYLAATRNGSPIVGVRKARIISSFSDPVTKIYLSVYPAINWSEGDTVTVTMGSGTNNVLSGTGTIYLDDAINTGVTQDLTARGPLFSVQKYKNNVTGGLTLTDLTGGPATDEAIAKAVLDVVGVTYTAANIGGTGLTRGQRVPAAYTWRQGETALDYLNRLTKASLGYRMVESIAGTIRRTQVFGRPSSVADYTLTEGVDILGGGHTQHDAFSRYTAVTVTGVDPGDGTGTVSFSYPNPTPAGVEAFVYPSDMIERGAENDVGGGISAQNVALNFVLPEVDRVAIRVSGIKTPRDDVFSPGQTHQIYSPRLRLTNELLWCMSVTRECDAKWFVQTMEYLGGGSAITYTGALPDGKATYHLPPRAPLRMRDYSHTDRFELSLIGKDAMVAGDQMTTTNPPPGRRERVIPQQPWSERAHGGMLNSSLPNANTVFLP